MNKIILGLATLAGLAIAGSAAAKLPPPTDEAKAKAAEAKNKAGWADKVSAYQLCMSQDKVAARYLKAKGTKPAGAPAAACQNPGPYVAQVVAAPAATAAAPAAPAAAAPAVAAPAAKPAAAKK